MRTKGCKIHCKVRVVWFMCWDSYMARSRAEMYVSVGRQKRGIGL